MSICCKNCETLAAIAEERKQELETICRAFDIEYGYDEETGVIVGRCNKLIEKEKELEKRVKDLEQKLNAQFVEMEEKLTAEEMENYELREKLSIAKEKLWEISDAFYRGTTLSELCYIAEQALQKISEVDDVNKK